MEKLHLQLLLLLIFVHLILGFKTIKLIAMKGIEQFTDIIAMAIGMAGALMKGLKKKLKIKTILITMSVAGILSYSLLGLLEIFYHDWTPRLIIFVSFVVGWLANEITEKIDLVFDDAFNYFLGWIKKKTK
mgnify:CR=1 FL=1